MDNKSTNPLVSIVIPVYKVELCLERCLDSIKKIEYKPVEVIIVNDASPDRCASIIDRYVKANDGWIAVHKKDNQGVASARISGLEISTGEYVMFVDSDDYVHPEILSRLVSAAIQNSSDITCCSYYIDDGVTIVEDERHLDKVYGRVEFRKFLEERLLYDCDINKAAIPVYLWGKLFRNKVDLLIPFMKEGKDFEFEEDLISIMYIFIFATEKLVCISDPLYYYVLRQGQITGQQPADLFYKRIKVWERLDIIVSDGLRKQLLSRMWYYIKTTLYSLSDDYSFGDYKIFINKITSTPVINKYIFNNNIFSMPLEIIRHPHYLFIKSHLPWLDYLFSRFINAKGRSRE